jgi:hypothetical protein
VFNIGITNVYISLAPERRVASPICPDLIYDRRRITLGSGIAPMIHVNRKRSRDKRK